MNGFAAVRVSLEVPMLCYGGIPDGRVDEPTTLRLCCLLSLFLLLSLALSFSLSVSVCPSHSTGGVHTSMIHSCTLLYLPVPPDITTTNPTLTPPPGIPTNSSPLFFPPPQLPNMFIPRIAHLELDVPILVAMQGH